MFLERYSIGLVENEKTNHTTSNNISTGSKNLRGFISCLIRSKNKSKELNDSIKEKVRELGGKATSLLGDGLSEINGLNQ